MHLCNNMVILKKETAFVLLLYSLTLLINDIHSQQTWSRWKRQLFPNEWNPWRSPLERFDKYVFSKKLPSYGEYVKGFSVPMYLEDTVWDPDYGEYPQWFLRRINCYLGVPYAESPTGPRRFQRAKPPNWYGAWDATYFRPACPQSLEEVQKDIPDFTKANISEDCLYMNIFVPNRTQPNLQPDSKLYPVMVFIHSGDFSTGTSQAQPGHVLAVRDVVVVTFNYRLGALGYLTTEDEHGPGNWGFSDQLQALDFIKRNIVAFRGDPNKITLMGDGAGAASVGLHLLSPASRDKGYYHQVIMMSGSDLSVFGFVDPFYRPREYAKKLATIVGCPTDDTYNMMICLRDNTTVSWESLVQAQKQIQPNSGAIGIVWAPTQDGLFFSLRTEAYFPETPDDLRRQGLFARVPAIIGINSMDGSAIANKSVTGLGGGISVDVFKSFVQQLLINWKIIDVYQPRAQEAIMFQYTHWPDPDNRTARGQEFINFMTDVHYGIGMDRIVKQQSDYSPTYMYIFHWKSWNDWLPWYLGVSHSASVPYVLGYPFLNETILNETEMVPRQYYDYDDRNISDFMMYMWSCFAIYGDPTPNITRNVTWEPYNQYNFTYLIINWHSQLWFRYRQSQYGFWNQYFPRMAKQDYFASTATPTPGAYQYVVATGCVSALLILLLGTMALLIYLLWYQHRLEEEKPYRHEPAALESPFSVSYGQGAPSISTSTSNMSGLTATQWAKQQQLQQQQQRYDQQKQQAQQYPRQLQLSNDDSSFSSASYYKPNVMNHSIV